MAVLASPARESPSLAGLWLAIGGLVLVGMLMGVGLVAGEVQGFWIGLAAVVGLLVLYDFRIGAALLDRKSVV